MLKRLTLAAFMVTALFVSAVRLPASACPASSPPIGQACKQGSCPNKACCAEAEKNKAPPSSQPLVKDDSTASLLVAVITPGLISCFLPVRPAEHSDRKSTRLNSSHLVISYAVFCLKKKKNYSDLAWTRLDLMTTPFSVIDNAPNHARRLDRYSRNTLVFSYRQCITAIVVGLSFLI